MARGSRRTIQEAFTGAKQVINLVVYATVSHEDVKVSASRIVVFTSPSNVKAYITSNPIRPSQRLVAMGNATGNELVQNGIKKFIVPASFSDVSLAQAVFAISATKEAS